MGVGADKDGIPDVDRVTCAAAQGAWSIMTGSDPITTGARSPFWTAPGTGLGVSPAQGG